jgi:hypothetical protein
VSQEERISDLQDQKAELEQKLSSTEVELASRESTLARARTTMEEVNSTLSATRDERDAFKADIEELKDALNDRVQMDTVDEIRRERDKAKLDAEKLRDDLMRAKSGWLAAEERWEEQRRDLLRDNERLQAALEEARGGAEAVAGAKRETEAYDGKILEVDMDRRFGVINLGKVHRVKRGMRFDVVRWRYNGWDTMGRVEVVRVFGSTAAVAILDEEQTTVECPLCGFTAPEGMAHCPYCSGGESGDRVVKLQRQEIGGTSALDETDPILPGDHITSPFYSREKELTFALAGEPQQFTTEELRALIREYGGEVSPKVSVETDYLVLAKIPEEGSAALMTEDQKKQLAAVKTAQESAKQYGVPIMREVELVNMLKTQ